MASLEEFVGDIELRLSRSKPSDDFELDKSQIKHWIDIVRDSLVADKLNVDIKKGKSIPAIYVRSEFCTVVVDEVNACNSGCGKRKSITVSDDILTLDDDRGVLRVVSSTGDWVPIYSADEARQVARLRFSKPGEDKAIGYREGQNIFIMGLTDLKTAAVKYNVFYVGATMSFTLSDPDEYPIESILAPIMLDEVEAIGRREFELERLEDLDNDGEQ